MGFSLKKAFKKVKKVAKKVESAGKKVAQKTMPSKVRKVLSKVVQNPVFQTVALTVATAGVGTMASAAASGALKNMGAKMVAKTVGQTLAKQATTGAILKQAAITGVKRAATQQVAKGVAKRIVAVSVKNTRPQLAQAAPALNRAGAVVNTMVAASIPTAAKIAQQGGNPTEQWVQSDTYKDTVVAATDTALRANVIAQLRANGMPENQLQQGADIVINDLSTKAVDAKKEGMGLGTMALVAVPILFAMMGG